MFGTPEEKKKVLEAIQNLDGTEGKFLEFLRAYNTNISKTTNFDTIAEYRSAMTHGASSTTSTAQSTNSARPTQVTLNIN